MIEILLAKLTLAWVLFIALIAAMKITTYYLMQKSKSRKDGEKIRLEDTIKSKEVQKCYLQARDLFRDLIQGGALNREQIIYLKILIDERLGSCEKYYPKHYKNDAHEIYSKLQSAYLTLPDYKEIIQVLNLIKNE